MNVRLRMKSAHSKYKNCYRNTHPTYFEACTNAVSSVKAKRRSASPKGKAQAGSSFLDIAIVELFQAMFAISIVIGVNSHLKKEA